MFRGRFAPLSRLGFKAGDLLEPVSPPTDVSRTLYGRAASPRCHYSMFKTPERKEFPSRQGGTFADNRPTPFDARKPQMVSRKRTISAKTGPSCDVHLMLYSGHSADLLRPNRPRRGGRAAECGGLLNPPALFALTVFYVFSVVCAALSCTRIVSFAG